MSESRETTESATETPSAEGIDSETLFSVLGRAHTLEILNEVLLGRDGPVRFGELQEALGLSPNTLSRRLEELVGLGLLDRTQFDEIPPRVEYEASEQLTALKPVFLELADWMDQYGSEPLYHVDCGSETQRPASDSIDR